VGSLTNSLSLFKLQLTRLVKTGYGGSTVTHDVISSTVSLTGPARSGVLLSRQGYFPYGEVRYVTGKLPAEFGFTGQRNDTTIGATTPFIGANAAAQMGWALDVELNFDDIPTLFQDTLGVGP